MRTGRLLSAVAAGVTCAALPVSASASGPPTSGSGTFVDSSAILVSFRQAGSVQFLVFDNVVEWAGAISGTAQETLYITVKPSGESVFQGTDVCPDGTIMKVQGSDSAGAFDGTYTAVGPNFKSHGTFQGLDDCGGGQVCGTYAGSFVS